MFCFYAGKDFILRKITPLCQILVYANSATNPVCYSACNSQFREGFKNYFQAWLSCFFRKPSSDGMKTSASRNGRNKISRYRFMCQCGDSSSDAEQTRNIYDLNKLVSNNNGRNDSLIEKTTVTMVSQETDKKELLTKV